MYLHKNKSKITFYIQRCFKFVRVNNIGNIATLERVFNSNDKQTNKIDKMKTMKKRWPKFLEAKKNNNINEKKTKKTIEFYILRINIFTFIFNGQSPFSPRTKNIIYL